MNRLLGIILAGGLTAAVGTAPVARAAKEEASHPGVLAVEDKAGAFSPDGVRKAEKAFHDTRFKAPTHFTVVTVNDSHVPESLKADFEAATKDSKLAGRVFGDWARDLAGRSKPGVFALVYVQDKRYYVRALSSEKTDVHRDFTQDDAQKLADVLQDGLKAARDQSGDEAKATRGEALNRAAGFVGGQLKDTSAPAAGTTRATAGGDDRPDGGGFFGGVGGLCCLAVVGLLGIWLIVGLIRAFSGGGGGGYGGGGGGGGFGGFFPSLLGGMFGAAAGMYLYDQFAGGSTASAADAAGADPGVGGDAGPDTYDGGADAGGGDFGDGGGDAGGGDFGGGDAGGGDFGGGGGDFGGGDW